MSTLTRSRQLERAVQARAQALAEQHEELHHRQASALAQLDCLRNVPFQLLRRLAPCCALRACMPATLLLNERVAGQFLYLVLRGTVTLTLHNRQGDEVLIGVLNRGDAFGEGPLFGDLFRGATVHAETICYLLQVPLSDVRDIMADSPELTGVLRGLYQHRLIESSLGRVPLFSGLSALERARIASLLQPQHYERGATIIHEGAPGDALYVIESGQVVVERQSQPIAYLDEGDFFGEMSLLASKPHNADILAITPVDVLALPAAEFTRLLRQQPILAEPLQQVVERRLESGASVLHNPDRVQQLSLAVEGGLMRGTRLLVRDPALCDPECHLCEDACATRHGQARLQIGGVQLDNLDVVDACRQCRVGAECVEACPEHAIQWDDRGALMITDQCSGCGACVPACPYGAVDLMPLTPASDQSLLWSLWRKMKRLRSPTIPLEAAGPTQRAVKCDLCHGYNDLACVSACPTGALRLVPVEDLFAW